MSEFSHPKYNRENLENSIKMIFDFIEETLKGQNRAVNIKQPKELSSIIDFSIQDKPQTFEELMNLCKQILNHQTKPYHPRYFNTLFGGFDESSIMGSMMIPAINGNMYTYQMAPCFTLMEEEVYGYLRKSLEWENIDGIMTPGGSFGNFMSIVLARHRAFPETKVEGIQHLPKLKIIASDVSHYSWKKGAIMCSLGTNSVSSVKTNQSCQMDVEDLQKVILNQIQNNNKPFIVCATAGTTVEGSIDNITEISKVCKKYKIWLHIDGAYAGVFLLTPKYRHKLGDCKFVDSVAWDPHKATLVPQQASVFVCQHKGLMDQSNSTVTEYLFHTERLSYDNSLDSGNKSFQCGRVPDIFKLWTYLKGNGIKGIEEQIQLKFHLTNFFKGFLDKNQERYLIAVKQCQMFNVCFWYVPKQLKKQEWSEEKFKQILSKVTVMSKKLMIEEGKIMIGYSSTKGSPYFWRIVFCNPYVTEEQVLESMKMLEEYCEESYKLVIPNFTKE